MLLVVRSNEDGRALNPWLGKRRPTSLERNVCYIADTQFLAHQQPDKSRLVAGRYRPIITVTWEGGQEQSEALDLIIPPSGPIGLTLIESTTDPRIERLRQAKNEASPLLTRLFDMPEAPPRANLNEVYRDAIAWGERIARGRPVTERDFWSQPNLEGRITKERLFQWINDRVQRLNDAIAALESQR